jgi:hypothetical protein
MRPASTPEGFEISVCWFLVQEFLERCNILLGFGRQSVYEIACTKKGFVPNMKWERTLSKEGKANFDDMTVFVFNNIIFLVSVWTCNTMMNTS